MAPRKKAMSSVELSVLLLLKGTENDIDFSMMYFYGRKWNSIWFMQLRIELALLGEKVMNEIH